MDPLLEVGVPMQTFMSFDIFKSKSYVFSGEFNAIAPIDSFPELDDERLEIRAIFRSAGSKGVYDFACTMINVPKVIHNEVIQTRADLGARYPHIPLGWINQSFMYTINY